jgi:hypothetical protein
MLLEMDANHETAELESKRAVHEIPDTSILEFPTPRDITQLKYASKKFDYRHHVLTF